ncbi:MAG TPA: hypothetical protein VGR62_05090 [Candidatus Binatia bacterium]|nr:hypothetical protein [Candidatus Binatia bacterium]
MFTAILDRLPTFPTTPDRVALRKLDAASGALVWAREMAFAGYGVSRGGLVVAPNGDVVLAAGTVSGGGRRLTVWRVNGATGADVWRRDFGDAGVPDVNAAGQVALDGNGDVLVGGYLRTGTSTDLVFLKLDGATGTERWRHAIPDAGGGPLQALVTIAPSGDAMVAGVVTGPSNQYVTFARLDGATGTAVWSDAIDESGPTGSETVVSLLVDSVGDVYLNAAAVVPPNLADAVWVVFAFSGVDGSLRWRQDRPGRVSSSDAPSAPALGALGPDDEVVMGGAAPVRPLPGADESVGIVATFTRDGADALAGSTLAVVDRAGRPSSRSVKLTAKIGTDIDVGLGADPRNGGGVLEVRNPVTGELSTVPLPASNWTAREGAKGLEYYAYSDRSRASGPCTSIAIKGGSLKATCKGDQIAFTLDEPTQGSLALRLTTGAGVAARRYCLVFGGDVSLDRPGSFRARRSGVPAVCPFP